MGIGILLGHIIREDEKKRRERLDELERARIDASLKREAELAEERRREMSKTPERTDQ